MNGGRRERAIDLPPDDTPVGSSGGFRFLFGDQYSSSAIAKADAKSWLWGSGLREGIECLETFLRDLHRILWIQSQPPISVEKDTPWDDFVVDLYTRADTIYERMTRWPERLDYLRSEFGIDVAWRKELDSIIKARNCLTHRRGVVEAKDCNSPDSDCLLIAYRFHELLRTTSGGAAVPLTMGEILEVGAEISLRPNVKKELRIAKGLRIALGSDVFHGLMYTVWAIGDACIAGGIEHARRQGIPETQSSLKSA